MGKWIIGVDPDVEESGVAIYTPSEQHIYLEKMKFFKLFDFLRLKHQLINLVVIEAGWLNKGNWHIVKGSLAQNAEIGRRTGANHEVGKKIVEMCQYLNQRHKLIKPTRSKVSHEQFIEKTGWKGRTNQEFRDACLLVWGMEIT